MNTHVTKDRSGPSRRVAASFSIAFALSIIHYCAVLYFFTIDNIGIPDIRPFALLLREFLPTLIMLQIAALLLFGGTVLLFKKHLKCGFLFSVLTLCVITFLKFDYAMYSHYLLPAETRSVIWERILGSK